MFSLICARIKGSINNREAGDLRRHCAYYDVIVMVVLVKIPQHGNAIVPISPGIKNWNKFHSHWFIDLQLNDPLLAREACKPNTFIHHCVPSAKHMQTKFNQYSCVNNYKLRDAYSIRYVPWRWLDCGEMINTNVPNDKFACLIHQNWLIICCMVKCCWKQVVRYLKN